MKIIFYLLLLFFLYTPVGSAQTVEVDSLKKALELESDDIKIVDILTGLATRLRGEDDESGIAYAENGLKIAKEVDYKYGIGEAYRSKADILYHQGKYEMANELYFKALPIYESVNNHKRVSRILNDIGAIYRYLGKSDEALKYCNRGLAIDIEAKDTASIAAAYTNIAMILLDVGKSREAIQNLQEVLLLDSLKKDWGYYVQDLSNIATVYKANYQYDEAIEYALRSYEFTDSIGDVVSAYHSSGVIGDIYREIGNLESSLEYLNISLDKAKQHGKSNQIGMTFGRLQMTYAKMDSIDQSLKCFDSAMIYAPPILEASLFNNMGQFYENKLNDFGSSIEYYQAAIEKSREISNLNLEIDPLINMGILKGKQGKYISAKVNLDRGLDLASDVNKPIEAEILERISETYVLGKYYKEGYEVLSSAYDMQDSLVMDQQKTQKKLLDYEKRIRDLEIVKKDSEIVEHNLKRKEQFIFISFLSFLLVSTLLFGYTIYKRGKRISRLNKSLKYLKDEIHHRVKNDFQSIASMLFIQINQITNVDVKKALSGVRERISTMGQIHMLFYKEGDYFRMGLAKYLKQIVESRIEVLSNDYIISNLNVKINIDDKIGGGISFDEAKQIGAVISEIITNSFKHAFEGNVNPEISFSADIDNQRRMLIQIKDNGNCESKKIENGSDGNFGLSMINMICQQLEWEINHKINESGSDFTILIPVKQ